MNAPFKEKVSTETLVTADQASASYIKGLEDQHEWAELIAALDASATADCVYCGAELGGLLGAFTWGIANGEGHCSRCLFPYRLYHRFPSTGYDKHGKPRGDVLLMAFVPLAEVPLQEPLTESEIQMAEDAWANEQADAAYEEWRATKGERNE